MMRLLPLLLLVVALVRADDLVLKLGDQLSLDGLSDAPISEAYELEITGDQVAAADTIALPNGEVLTYHDCPNKQPGYETYEFEGAETDAEAELTVGTLLNDVNGDVEDKDGQAYEISYLGQGKHAWLVMDMEALEKLANQEGDSPNDDDDVGPSPGSNRDDFDVESFLLNRGIPQDKLDEAKQKGLTDSTTMVQISVKVYFTQEYEDKTSDVQGAIEGIIGSVNQGFINTGVKIQINLHCIERYIGEEPQAAKDLWPLYNNYKDTTERLLATADLSMILVSKSDYCGQGGYMTVDFPRSFSEKWCAESWFVAGHEIGHNLGAHHDEGQVGDIGYGRGYLMDNKKRTNMAYNTDKAHGNRINYYSDDTLNDNQNDGLGNTGADNSRMMQERRFMYELIGDESQTCDGTFMSDLDTGIYEWSDWENHGCLDAAKPMTRTKTCRTKYFPCSKCKDRHQKCDYWASIGECDKNPAYMVPNCALSCKKCHPVETDACKDNDYRCYYWASIGECDKNPGYMLHNCALSCQQCQVEEEKEVQECGNCKDTNGSCKWWASIGECDKNPGYMLHNCKWSCGEPNCPRPAATTAGK